MIKMPRVPLAARFVQTCADVSVGAGPGTGVCVAVGRGRGVAVRVLVGGTRVLVAVGATVAVCVGGTLVGVTEGVTVAVAVSVGTAVSVGSGVAVGSGPHAALSKSKPIREHNTKIDRFKMMPHTNRNRPHWSRSIISAGV